jgi:hypothetical protein
MAYTGLGAGITGDPFQITTAAEFKQMSNYPSGNSVAFTGTGVNDLLYVAPNTLLVPAVFTVTITKYKVIAVSYLAASGTIAGTGYVVNDTFSIDGGADGYLAVGKVLTIGTAGKVASFVILDGGQGYTQSSQRTTTAITGVGTGMQVFVSGIKDYFSWKKDSEVETIVDMNVNTNTIYGFTYSLKDGVRIASNSVSGHTLGAQWVFTVAPTRKWKMMNSIDMTAESSLPISSFYGGLDGNGFEIQNAPSNLSFDLKYGGFLTNLTIRITRGIGGILLSSLASGTFYDTSLTFIHVVVTGTGLLDKITGDTMKDGCVVNNIVLEGNIRAGFNNMYVPIEYVRFLRNTPIDDSYGGLVFGLNAPMRYCQVIAPLTPVINDGGNHGLLCYSFSTSGASITECFVLSNFKGRAPITGKAVNTLIGYDWNTDMPISDCYFKGDFSVDGGEETVTAQGNQAKSGYMISANSTIHASRCYSIGDIKTPQNKNRTILVKENNTASNFVQNCFYDKTKLVSITPKDITGQQTGLTSVEFLDSAKFTGWNFSTIWQMGATSPELRNNPIYSYELAMRTMDTPLITKLSTTQFTVELFVGTFDNSTYGVDVLQGTTLVYNAENINVNIITVPILDLPYTIKPYWLDAGVKNYTFTIAYSFYAYDGAINITTVVASAKVVLTYAGIKAQFVHGSLIYGGYIYGSTRSYNAPTGCIVKAPVGNISAFINVPIWSVSEGVGGAVGFDQIVVCGNYLYALGQGMIGTILLQYKLADDTYKVFTLTDKNNVNQPIISDGEFLYLTLYNGTTVNTLKVDPNVFISDLLPKFNTATIFSFAVVATYDDSTQGGHILGGYSSRGKGYTHCAVVDSEYLYLGYTSANGAITDANGYSATLNKTLHELQKVDKRTMLAAGWVYISKATDDMAQNDTHMFFGGEIQPGADVRTYGYGWGAFSVRKSDLRLTALPKLHMNDVIPTTSYGSLLFGNYLLDTKTNLSTYILDITDVDNWVATEPLGKRTLKTYNYTFGGVALTGLEIPNEFLLAESNNKFYAFLWVGGNWNASSGLMEVSLTGLSYFAPPTVNTIGSVVTGTDVAFTGYVLNSGGHAVTSKGFRYGTSSGALTSSITSAETTLEFHGIVLGLPAGTYYYQAYAISSEGESVAEIKSFSVLNTIPFYVGPSHVQAIYLGATKIL